MTDEPIYDVIGLENSNFTFKMSHWPRWFSYRRLILRLNFTVRPTRTTTSPRHVESDSVTRQTSHESGPHNAADKFTAKPGKYFKRPRSYLQ